MPDAASSKAGFNPVHHAERMGVSKRFARDIDADVIRGRSDCRARASSPDGAGLRGRMPRSAPSIGGFRRICASVFVQVREYVQRFHEARQAQAARDIARMRRALQLDELPHEGQPGARLTPDRR
jgi:hypothetical protein